MLEFVYDVREVAAGDLRAELERPGARPDMVLLDVRQPLEYQAGHLPGAVSIPVAELGDRLAELDPRADTVIYCAAGVRSRAAAGILLHHGFSQVRHLNGGYQSWQGQKAQGMPNANLALFAAVSAPPQHVALAWVLEEGARQFYQQASELLVDQRCGPLFTELARAEEGHKQLLLAVYEGLINHPVPADFPFGLLPEGVDRGIMEGGYRVADAVAKARQLDVGAVCELAIAVEVNAYDHYLILQRQAPDENSQRVYEVLAGEERRHLQWLTKTLDELLANAGAGTPSI
jgi:sulfur-carrier protein adenylyltransferase/sulfurtransferase